MKKLSFAVVGAAALALAACGAKQEEATSNAEENLGTENLEALATETANETETLANQAESLNSEANAAEAAPVDETDSEAQNVTAM